MKHRTSSASVRVLACVTGLLICATTARADALHKYFKEDTYWHHGSGWLYPRHVGDFTLDGSPTQVDGNDDLSAIYKQDANDMHRLAIVDLYYPQSASKWAQLSSARAGVMVEAQNDECTVESKADEKTFVLENYPQISGVKVTFVSLKAGCDQRALYFFRAPNWIVSVRTTSMAVDLEAVKIIDSFVRALRWDSLDTDPNLRETIK
ncbi:MAG: hypothetical protein QM808_06515 [Steroidobacteraceae bacterium]